MATLPRRPHGSTAFVQAAGIALALAVLAGSGCASRVFSPARLPDKYQAQVTHNIEAIDLSRLANYSVNSHLIDRDDVLEVTTVTDYSRLSATTTPVRVREDGTANIPLIGKVAVAGLELDEAEQAIAAAGKARGVFRNPHVTVTMKRQHTNKITVIGAVKNPGVYELRRSGSSLLAALVTAGGLSEHAGSEVEIRRPVYRRQLPPALQPQRSYVAQQDPVELTGYRASRPGEPPVARITRVNLAAAAAEGNGGRYLEDGDVVMVAKRIPKPIYVTGLVRKPGEYELPPNQDVYLLDALAKAGDRAIEVADKAIVIRRIPGEKEPIVIECSIQRAKANGTDNVRLAPGDIVSVEDTPLTVLMRTFRDVVRVAVGGSASLY